MRVDGQERENQMTLFWRDVMHYVTSKNMSKMWGALEIKIEIS